MMAHMAFSLYVYRIQSSFIPSRACSPRSNYTRYSNDTSRWLIGGIGITIMLWIGHIALSAHMPGIAQYDIPMGHIITPLGPWVYMMFIFIIYAEIFTTLIADLYGLSLQLERRTAIQPKLIVIIAACYLLHR